MTRKLLIFSIIAPAIVLLTSSITFAQSSTTFAAGLKGPTRLLVTSAGNVIVVENGTGNNDGRVSLIDPNGARRTLIDGLPSGINTAEGQPAPSGPSAIAIRKKVLYVLIGQGDAVTAGPVQGSQVVNTQNSSPLFSSVLAFKFGSQIDSTAGEFALTVANQDTIDRGGRVKLNNSAGEKVTAQLVADFRNFVYEFRPDFPDNVRVSNPFGLAVLGDKLYVADASLNLLREVDINTGDTRLIARFGALRNPLPFGPPFAEAVPDNVRVFGDHLLVTLLTGFPFAPGLAEVRRINLSNNSQATQIGGLTSAIDVLPVEGANGEFQFYTLEFSTNLLQNNPGRLRLFNSAGASPVTIAENLISPTSIGRNEQTGAIYVSEIFTGRIIRIQVP